MRILFLGDIMGRSGREGVKQHLPTLKDSLKPDVIILNAENAAGGIGVTNKIAQDFFDLGATCLTTGNHVWAQKEIVTSINDEPRLLRPLNFKEDAPGHGSYLHTLSDGRKILIINALGRLFMNNTTAEDPFATTKQFLNKHALGKSVQAIFIDFHAEATSEKMAYAHYFDGKVSAVIGTHTHIPTADEHILPKGTAYQTDAGMCGDYDSVIGMKKEAAIARFVKSIPSERLTPAENKATVCGIFIETDDSTGLTLKIDRIQMSDHA